MSILGPRKKRTVLRTKRHAPSFLRNGDRALPPSLSTDGDGSRCAGKVNRTNLSYESHLLPSKKEFISEHCLWSSRDGRGEWGLDLGVSVDKCQGDRLRRPKIKFKSFRTRLDTEVRGRSGLERGGMSEKKTSMPVRPGF